MRRPVLALLVVLAACGNVGGDTRITVLAASSLTRTATDIAGEYERQTDVDVTLSFGSSARMVAQVEAGAPADVVLTADSRTAAQLGIVRKSVVFARNRMAIVVARTNPRGIRSLADLARPGLRLVLASPEVPAGRYAAEVLRRAGVTVAPVSLEPDAKATTAKVILGEADAALVYVTEVDAAMGLEQVAVPEEHNVDVQYVAVAVRPGGVPFLDFLLAPTAQRILADAGFRPA